MLAALAGCASPSPVLYTLAPVPGPAQPGGPKLVSVREVSLARYLERSQIVRSSEGYQLAVEANNWWGEPLGAMIGRVLEEELSQRLPGTTVIGDTGAIGGDPDAVVETNILRFDADHAGTVVLRAQVAVTFPKSRRTPRIRSVRLTAPPATADIRGEVAGMSVVLGQLADTIAGMLRA
ncbi:MAG: membrane integrity-associated transporter subunit PqiC [Acetobacteraceae bacterium]|nr:membrane integrity-associated transporter subunit PqiC [Acetobacteraceae bacterium]